LYRLIAGDHADARLESWKRWLISNNALVMSVLLLVLGLALVGQACVGLFG
jgi:hypothetical protein